MPAVHESASTNPVLQRILTTRQVTDGTSTLNLDHPDTPGRNSHIQAEEGALLQRAIAHARPRTSLEVGMAYGISTLYICEALARHSPAAPVHYALDPFQRSLWRGIGLQHVREAGFGEMVRFLEERSEFALPTLARDGVRLDFAFIDGWHTFDQVMVEFYFINRMLNVGGVVAFDDAARPAVNRAIRYALNYPAYRVFGGQPFTTDVTWKGKIRQTLRESPRARALVRHDVLVPDWERGIAGTCIAIEKVAEDDGRSSGWYREF